MLHEWPSSGPDMLIHINVDSTENSYAESESDVESDDGTGDTDDNDDDSFSAEEDEMIFSSRHVKKLDTQSNKRIV